MIPSKFVQETKKRKMEMGRMEVHKANSQIVINSEIGEEIKPNTTDGAYGKHVPVIE